MRLASVWTADQKDVVGVVEEVAAMKFTDQRLVASLISPAVKSKPFKSRYAVKQEVLGQ
jgi:hypothetical protein